jgi:hypothetical protein
VWYFAEGKVLRTLVALALVFGFSSITMGEVSATVYLSDANTPLKWADPNVPYVYRDIMVDMKLKIIVSSDSNDFWSGKLEITVPDVNYGVLSARDYNDVTCFWESSVLEAAGFRARVWPYKNTCTAGIRLTNGFAAKPGDWFIVDYTATTAGLCKVSFYEYFWKADKNYDDENPPDPIVSEVNKFVFSHVPSRDFNRDTKVDFVDYAIISAFRGMTDCADSNWCEGTDLDTDGDVDIDDLILFADYWLERTE